MVLRSKNLSKYDIEIVPVVIAQKAQVNMWQESLCVQARVRFPRLEEACQIEFIMSSI